MANMSLRPSMTFQIAAANIYQFWNQTDESGSKYYALPVVTT